MIILEPSQVSLRSAKASEGNRWAANRINGPAAVNSCGRNESLPVLEGRKPAKELAMSSTNGTECRSLIVLGTDLFFAALHIIIQSIEGFGPPLSLHLCTMHLLNWKLQGKLFLSFFLSFFCLPPPPPTPTPTPHTHLIFLLLYGKDAF